MNQGSPCRWNTTRGPQVPSQVRALVAEHYASLAPRERSAVDGALAGGGSVLALLQEAAPQAAGGRL